MPWHGIMGELNSKLWLLRCSLALFITSFCRRRDWYSMFPRLHHWDVARLIIVTQDRYRELVDGITTNQHCTLVYTSSFMQKLLFVFPSLF